MLNTSLLYSLKPFQQKGPELLMTEIPCPDLAWSMTLPLTIPETMSDAPSGVWVTSKSPDTEAISYNL